MSPINGPSFANAGEANKHIAAQYAKMSPAAKAIANEIAAGKTSADDIKAAVSKLPLSAQKGLTEIDIQTLDSLTGEDGALSYKFAIDATFDRKTGNKVKGTGNFVGTELKAGQTEAAMDKLVGSLAGLEVKGSPAVQAANATNAQIAAGNAKADAANALATELNASKDPNAKAIARELLNAAKANKPMSAEVLADIEKTMKANTDKLPPAKMSAENLAKLATLAETLGASPETLTAMKASFNKMNEGFTTDVPAKAIELASQQVQVDVQSNGSLSGAYFSDTKALNNKVNPPSFRFFGNVQNLDKTDYRNGAGKDILRFAAGVEVGTGVGRIGGKNGIPVAATAQLGIYGGDGIATRHTKTTTGDIPVTKTENFEDKGELRTRVVTDPKTTVISEQKEIITTKTQNDLLFTMAPDGTPNTAQITASQSSSSSADGGTTTRTEDAADTELERTTQRINEGVVKTGESLQQGEVTNLRTTSSSESLSGLGLSGQLNGKLGSGPVFGHGVGVTGSLNASQPLISGAGLATSWQLNAEGHIPAGDLTIVPYVGVGGPFAGESEVKGGIRFNLGGRRK
jgi:hypothetical protein